MVEWAEGKVILQGREAEDGVNVCSPPHLEIEADTSQQEFRAETMSSDLRAHPGLSIQLHSRPSEV